LNNLTVLGHASMTSREIADLVEVRHDSVKRTIERLVERGVIAQPPLVDGEKSANGVVEKLYLFTAENKRDSYVVVAQLSPEFTGRMVDRWQELETPKTPGEALVEMAQTFLRHKRRMAALEAEHQALAVQQQETAVKVRAIADGDGFFAVAAYANLHQQPVDNQLAALFGKRASAICRARGLPVGRARHPLWGEVNTYHANVLAAVFAEVTWKAA
jgi:phage regulator Rha-like protein